LVLGGAAILIEKAPEVEVRNDVFYRTVAIGPDNLCIAMQPPIFLRALLLAEEAYAKWQLAAMSQDDSNVVPFPRQ
jgi:hypothetical protein